MVWNRRSSKNHTALRLPILQKKGDPSQKIFHARDRDTVAQSFVPGRIGGPRYFRPAIGKPLEALTFQGRQAADVPGRVCGMNDQVGGLFVLSGDLGAGDLIFPETVRFLAGVDPALHHKGAVVSACPVGGGDGGGGFVGAGTAAVQAVVFKYERLMPPCLRPEGGGLVIGATHPLSSLVVKAENTRFLQNTGVSLSGLSAASGKGCMDIRCQKAITVALADDPRRNKGLLFHSRLSAQRACHIMQIPHLISLICRKSNDSILACGHLALVPIKALRHKGLHLHIGCGHERPGHPAQVYGFFSLVNVEGEHPA